MPSDFPFIPAHSHTCSQIPHHPFMQLFPPTPCPLVICSVGLLHRTFVPPCLLPGTCFCSCLLHFLFLLPVSVFTVPLWSPVNVYIYLLSVPVPVVTWFLCCSCFLYFFDEFVFSVTWCPAPLPVLFVLAEYFTCHLSCASELPQCASLSCQQNARCMEEALTGQLVCQCLPGYQKSGDQCLCEFIYNYNCRLQLVNN